MSLRKSSLPTKEHTLAICARLFLEQGYRETTIKQITTEAGISNSSFQNFFRNKEGILAELARIVFSSQFDAARAAAGNELPGIFTYALETSVQLVLTERDEHLREIYVAAYTQPETSEFIHENTARELKSIFGDRFPEFTEQDFYEMDIGSAGLMCGYMAKPCSIHFPLERKVERFLSSALRTYRVSEDELAQILSFIRGQDIGVIASGVFSRLLTALELWFDARSPTNDNG